MKALALTLMTVLTTTAVAADGTLDSIADRFGKETTETPDFQRHVIPLMGKLGCNGRACHGSFQGRGGFRLSLFGYDFKADHDEIYGRVDPETPSESLVLQKPLMQIAHEGGQRIKPDTWQQQVLLNWIKADCPPRPEDAAKLTKLDVTPAEIQFDKDDQTVQLKAIAIWSDGSREDVTEICRFQSNDDMVADISSNGLITGGSPGDTHVVVFYDNAVVPVPVMRPVSDRTGDNYPETPTPTEIDRLVVERLKKLGVVQSGLSTDEEFLRRVSLDVTGALPTADEVRAFVADSNPNKRSAKIDELLERPGYAAWWAQKLCDYTGNSDDQLNNVTPVRQEASRQWYNWMYSRVEQNMHYDDIVEGIVMANSRDPGESYEEYCRNMSRLYHSDSDYDFSERKYLPHYWARRNFQQPEDRVIGFAYTFLGVRIQCAQCHKHPFDQWTQDDFKGFQGFFTATSGRTQNPRPEDRDMYQKMLAKFEVEGQRGNDLRRKLTQFLKDGETVPFGEVYTAAPPKKPTAKQAKQQRRRRGGRIATEAKLLGQDPMDLTGYEDIRQPLMDWLRSADNPLFAKAFVNRVWASYFNVGIVNPPDDMNLANPPSNAALLDYLAKEFIAHDFDIKWLHREILNSRTYQLSWIPNETNRLDERNFARAVPRRLPAEIAWDIVSQAVSNDQRHAQFCSSNEDRAIATTGAGLRYNNGNRGSTYALSIFGRSIRESNCDCDRSEEPSLLQTIFMRNDDQVLGMLDSRNGYLAQVAEKNGIRFNARQNPNADKAQLARLNAQRKQLSRQLAQQNAALKKLKKGDAEKNARQITRTETTIDKIRRRLKALNGDPEPIAEEQPDTNEQIDVARTIEDIYLRTLSRKPTESEAQVASEYISQSKDPLEGIRGVMWAVLNTKEFIVNH